ncbi:MAG TPA: bifunctional UDP-N-acetylglucosamine diphosphorylase/glucosamine-1-phosphate N-acetyltransferase GlmU [Hyphomicrobiaceae bacterium]|nr:bifunctional UDP-N-acetylglucosamine diphosphorylase/glucosamine-1-phosphate N-acetyltransferase GlmU [Hyphomicrobiaceae bacterium]
MTTTPLLTVVLAAGKGTRMKSALPKVMHRLAGLSILGHVLNAAQAAGSSEIAVVIGPDMDVVRAEVGQCAPRAKVFVQHEPLGTAHAVLSARQALAGHRGDVLVLVADIPLLTPASIARLRAALEAGHHVAVLGFNASDPNGYGRLITDASGALLAIREHEDASEEERAIGFCNSGVLAFRHADLLSLLDRIGGINAQGEYYLTDVIEVARREGLKAAAVACPQQEGIGINSRDQLAAAERIYQDRRRLAVMLEGATLIAPETVWFSHDTRIGRDVIIEPNVFFGPGVVVEDGVVIRANCHFTGARIRAGAEVGPFARFRPGADIGPGVHIGNFVEVKNSTLEEGAKANHLAYIGDGRVGARTNIGAGTILCNYDGFNKHRTDIGAGAFIGSNTSLVAPVKVGDGAYIGSGSVITKDVPADALALERTEQHVRPGWAAKFRALMRRQKAQGTG